MSIAVQGRGVRDLERDYLDMVVDSIRVSAGYRPKFGRGRERSLTLEQFRQMYGGDAFYHWFGLDDPMVYGAHRSAGGLTSLYRQIGHGCEKLVRRIIRDSFGLTDDDVMWSYEVNAPGAGARTLRLDARIPLEKIGDVEKRRRFLNWMRRSAAAVGVDGKVADNLHGAVFEIRQGYKSKDSKRQNADIANATQAYMDGYFPCIMVLSEQVDGDVLARYRESGWCIVTGALGKSDPHSSTYDFMRDVVGYDLAGFFERNSNSIRGEINGVLKAILDVGAT